MNNIISSHLKESKIFYSLEDVKLNFILINDEIYLNDNLLYNVEFYKYNTRIPVIRNCKIYINGIEEGFGVNEDCYVDGDIGTGLFVLGKEEGFWIRRNKKDMGFYKNGMIEGLWVYRDFNDKTFLNYLNNKKQEFSISYYSDKKIKSKGEYVDGEKDGIWHHFKST